MEIKVGQKYLVTPKYKKSVAELEFWRKGDRRFTIETLWRSGSWYITPQTDDEVVDLINCYENEEVLELYDFEDVEFLETYDGCATDWSFHNIDDEEEQEDIKEMFWEEGRMYFEDEGWDELDSELYIYNGIELEEVNDEDG